MSGWLCSTVVPASCCHRQSHGLQPSCLCILLPAYYSRVAACTLHVDAIDGRYGVWAQRPVGFLTASACARALLRSRDANLAPEPHSSCQPAVHSAHCKCSCFVGRHNFTSLVQQSWKPCIRRALLQAHSTWQLQSDCALATLHSAFGSARAAPAMTDAAAAATVRPAASPACPGQQRQLAAVLPLAVSADTHTMLASSAC